VELVEHHVLQILEELHPLGVVGEDPGVEHVRIRDDHVPGGADGRPGLRRRVAVIGEGLELDVHLAGQPLELGELVLGERFGREQVQGSRRGILRDRVEDRQVVAEGLARRGRCHHHDVLLLMRDVERRGLVRVERLHTARAQRS